MATDDEFESFRGAIADLDDDRERRIRSKFEGFRGPLQPTSNSPTATPTEPASLHVVDPSVEPPPNARHRRPVLVGVAAAVVLMVLIGSISLLRSSDDGTDVASSIDDLPLSDLAARAGGKAAVAWPADAILHGSLRTGSVTAKVRDRAETLRIADDEEWTRQDGTGKVREQTDVIALGPGTPMGTPDPAHFIEKNDPRPLRGVAAYDELMALPTDPNELLRLAAFGLEADDSAGVAGWLAQMLSMEIVPPAARAAGFLALEQIGAVPIGPLKNYSDNESAAYEGFDENERPWVVLVDPVTTLVTGFASLGGEGEAIFSGAERWTEFGPQDFVDEMPD